MVAMALGIDTDDLEKWSKNFKDHVHDSLVEDVEANEMRDFKLLLYIQVNLLSN